jgi:hypothetical protein
MEICSSLFASSKSFKDLRADVYSHKRNTIWLNCHCGGLFEFEYVAAKKLLTSVDSFRKKIKHKNFSLEELENQLAEYKQELQERVSQLSERCLDLGLAYT